MRAAVGAGTFALPRLSNRASGRPPSSCGVFDEKLHGVLFGAGDEKAEAVEQAARADAHGFGGNRIGRDLLDEFGCGRSGFQAGVHEETSSGKFCRRARARLDFMRRVARAQAVRPSACAGEGRLGDKATRRREDNFLVSASPYLLVRFARGGFMPIVKLPGRASARTL